jgi:anthranilate/para-aminobenzoate synthase component I
LKSDLREIVGKEGTIILYTGAGRGKTLIGYDPIRCIETLEQLDNAKNPLMGYLAYPNIKLKNQIPSVQFYEYKKIESLPSIVVPSLVGEHTRNSSKEKCQPSVTKKEYFQKIHQIKKLLAAGEIYQINYAIRFRKKFTGDPFALFQKLNAVNPAEFSAYLNCGGFQIISSSPERFFQIKNGRIMTTPIKGTASIAGGKKNLAKLMASEKERAELDMITDLERNDVGKICEYGTLKLTKERALLELPNLWHTYSQVEGKLLNCHSCPPCHSCGLVRLKHRTGRNLPPSQIISAMFPGGSITGCPKLRAMEYIEKLENLPRNIYTGSIGYILNSKIDLNIAIRTILIKDGYAEFWAGGGIVADSTPVAEYAEAMLKAEKILAII